MDKATLDRRLLENEAVFRQMNESVHKGFEKLDELARSEGHAPAQRHETLPLHFYCECSDETCVKRVRLTPDAYRTEHRKRNRFVVLSGHEVARVEHVIRVEPEYVVAEKYDDPPEDAGRLQATDIKNHQRG